MEICRCWRYACSQCLYDKKIVPKLLEDKVEVVLFVGDLIQGGKGQSAEGMTKELTEWKN